MFNTEENYGIKRVTLAMTGLGILCFYWIVTQISTETYSLLILSPKFDNSKQALLSYVASNIRQLRLFTFN